VPREALAELFDILDLDNSEGISENEFVEGVIQLVISDVPFSSLHEIRLLKQIRRAQEDAKTELLCIYSNLKEFTSSEVAPTFALNPVSATLTPISPALIPIREIPSCVE